VPLLLITGTNFVPGRPPTKKLDVLPSAWSKTSIPNISAQKSLPFHEAKFVEGALTGEVEAILADLK
jgi:hypothetical protein